MRTESLASSQSGRSIDTDAWCKQALSFRTNPYTKGIMASSVQGRVKEYFF